MVIRATSPKRKRKRGAQKARVKSEPPEAADIGLFTNESKTGHSSQVIQSKRMLAPGSSYTYPPILARTSFQEQTLPSTLQPYPQLGLSSSLTRSYYPSYAERYGFSHSHFPSAAGSPTPGLFSAGPVPSGSRTVHTISGFHSSGAASTASTPMESEPFHSLDPQSTLLDDDDDDEMGGGGNGSNLHEATPGASRQCSEGSEAEVRAF
jgi:hypothetical protein